MSPSTRVHVYTFLVTLLVILIVLVPASAKENMKYNTVLCPRYPKCSVSYSVLDRLSCWFGFKEVRTRDDKFQRETAVYINEALSVIKGQDHIIPTISNAVKMKLVRPSMPLVMQFTGDNGVGKTQTAYQISLALSLRCKREACNYGDNMLIIAGSGYDGFGVAKAKAQIINSIKQHASVYPHGIILINDIQSLDKDVVVALTPLFGREESFPELVNVNLHLLTVIITNDFGLEGRTQGLGVREINELAAKDFRDNYSVLAGTHLQTFSFLSLDLKSAEEVIKSEISRLPCRYPDSISAVVFDDVITSHVMNEVIKTRRLPHENGRLVSKLVHTFVDSVVAEKILKHPRGMRFVAHLQLDPNSMSIVVSAQEADGSEL